MIDGDTCVAPLQESDIVVALQSQLFPEYPQFIVTELTLTILVCNTVSKSNILVHISTPFMFNMSPIIVLLYT